MKKLLFTLFLSTLLLGCSSKASQTPQSYEISEKQAKMSVLNNIPLKEEDCSFFSIEKDIEDNRDIYEIEIHDQQHRYQFILDRYSGEILKSTQQKIETKKEDVDKDVQQNTNADVLQQETPIVIPVDQNTNQETKEPTTQNQQLLSYEEALQLVTNKMPNISIDVIEMELDYENGNPVYEGEFYYQKNEYEFEINAKTGTFLKWHIDKDD